MRIKSLQTLALWVTSVALFSCGENKTTDSKMNEPQAPTDTATARSITEETITYTADGKTMKGFISYNAGDSSSRPVVLVVPEWWGLNDYPRNRARQLAEMGYTAMAVDMFGDGKIAANPQEAMELTKPFYSNPALFLSRVNAALTKLKDYKQADLTNAAAIGYCFGGSAVLNAAKLGADLKGVVCFHGGLAGAPADKNLLKAKVLVCHGGADSFVPPAEVAGFKKSMDSIGADYQFNVYPDATHAFTNPEATATGKKFNMPITYNAAADSASWNDMKAFFGQIFPR